MVWLHFCIELYPFNTFADDDEYDVYYDCDENENCNTTYKEDEFDYYDYEETIKDIKDYFKTHGVLPPDAHFGGIPYYEPHTSPKEKYNPKRPDIIDEITKPYEDSTKKTPPMYEKTNIPSKSTKVPYEDNNGKLGIDTITLGNFI